MPYMFSALAPEYARLYSAMTINPDRVAEFAALAKKRLAAMDRYKTVEKATGVPASVIAVIHEREASGDFTTYLGNGQPLNRVTTMVPVGEGPFASWEDGAINALNLQLKQLGLLSKVLTWSIEFAAWFLEAYNGFGPRMKGVPTGYLWAGTNQYKGGKYVADGVWNPNYWDTQPGCMPLLYVIWQLDRTLALHLATDAPQPAPQPIPAPTPPDVPLPRPRPPVPTPMPSQPSGGLIALIIAAASLGLLWASQVLHAALQFLHLSN